MTNLRNNLEFPQWFIFINIATYDIIKLNISCLLLECGEMITYL